MTRTFITFACEGSQLAGTLDHGDADVGLLIVSGGNELRSGAFSGMSQLAARIAHAGFPVFRFDRRGVGDSEGENCGFLHSGPDIAAAVEAYQKHAPHMRRIIAFGNCDGASALALQSGNGFDALVLSNPWTIEDEDDTPPPAAIRARYAEKLRNPRELGRLLKGQVSFGKLARGVIHAMRPAPPSGSLADAVREGINRFDGPVRILLAERDRTAQVFAAGWDKNDPRVQRCANASHAYAEPQSREWLYTALMESLTNEQACQLNVG
ncbi:MAG: hydrolase 1, exosortase A system-associated [Novosphingobium sp.]|nr:hydrolase 1, exosortase A system-associated [Novosphingobium sp.]